MARSMPSSPGHAVGLRPQGRQVEPPVGGKRQHAVGRAAVADAHGQRPRVHARHAGNAARAQPGIQMLRRPPVGRLGDVLLHHEAAGGDRGRLDVLGIGCRHCRYAGR